MLPLDFDWGMGDSGWPWQESAVLRIEDRGQGGQGGAGSRVSSLAPHGAGAEGPLSPGTKGHLHVRGSHREEGRTRGQVLTK